MSRRSANLLLSFFILFKLVFHFFIVNPAYDLHRDEYLHIDQANHLAAGYLSVPPFTAFVSLVIKWLGGGIFWVRFFPALFGALTMLLVWRIIEMLKGGGYAQLLAALLFICSAMSRINMLYQPNSFDVLSWTLVFYLLTRYVLKNDPRLLLWLGAVIGTGFLNKYNIIFLVIGLLPALLISLPGIFRNKYLYGGALIALLLVTPNIVWQIQNGMPVIHHMKELEETQLVNVDRSGFIKDQLLHFILGTVVWIAALVAFFRYAPFKPSRFVVWTFLIVMALFIYLRAKSYYAIGLYPVLLAFGSVYWERLFSAGWLRHLRVVWLILIIAPTVILFRLIFPVLSPQTLKDLMVAPERREIFAKWEDGKLHELPQDFADMQGWRELADVVAQTYQSVPVDERKHTLVVCDNYGQAGAINFYSGGRVSPAIAFNADYIFWFPAIDTLQHVIIVGSELEGYVRKYASASIKTGQISNTLAREYGTTVHLLNGISPVLPEKLKQWQHEEQDAFRAWK